MPQSSTKRAARPAGRRNSVIVNPAAFYKGLLMTLCTLVALAAYLVPLPQTGGRSALRLSEDLFNALSKGSTNFLEDMRSLTSHFAGFRFEANINGDSAQDAADIAAVATAAGVTAASDANTVSVAGDLGALVGVVLQDAADMFTGNGAALMARYRQDARQVMYWWWRVLSAVEDNLLQTGAHSAAKNVGSLITKVVEPAYNYYQVAPETIVARAPAVAGLLIVYIIGALWWGTAIYYLLQGLGVSAAKPAKPETRRVVHRVRGM